MVRVPLHVLYSFPLRVGVSGIGMTAWHQVAGLAELGVNVTLCCGTLEKPISGLHCLVETMRVAGLRVPYRLIGQERSVRLHDERVGRLLRKLHPQFAVVHSWPLGSVRTLRVAKDLGVPTVLERPNAHTAFAYEVVAQEHECLGLPLPQSHTHATNIDKLAVEEAEYELADKLACPSDFVARTFTDRGFLPSQIVRHQYGYCPTEFRSNRPTRRSPFTVAFVGRCEPRKGLHYALEAWHKSGADAHGRFIICGTYVEGYRKLLAPLLRHRSIEERGFVTNVEAVLHEADVLVLPSIEEGSALVTYEARGSGCVVLASHAAGAVGADGVEVVLHEARNVSQLAQQLANLSTNRDQLEEMRRQSLLSIDTLTWTHAARVLIGHYAAAGEAKARPAVLSNHAEIRR